MPKPKVKPLIETKTAFAARTSVPLIVTALLMLPMTEAAVGADQLTAGELHEWCSSTDAFVHQACKFYVLGADEGIEAGDSSTRADGGDFIERPNAGFTTSGALLVFNPQRQQ
jgi:hypothetical protein